MSPFGFPEVSAVGSRIKVVCSSNEEAALSWFKDGILLPSRSNGIVLETVGDFLVLLIESVRPSHSGNYTCKAANFREETAFSATLVVTAAPEWISVPKDVSVRQASSVELQCLAEGFPEPRIEWSHDDGRC